MKKSKREIKELSRETMLSLLDSHPEWLYMQFDRIYTYDSARRCFGWEGWDSYNDDMMSDFIHIDPPKRGPVWMRKLGGITHFAVVDNREVWFWRDKEWNLPKKTRLSSPTQSFVVLTKPDILGEV